MSARRLSILLALVLGACSVQRWQPARMASTDEHMSHMMAADVRAPASSGASQAAAQGQGVAGLPASAVTANARISASPRHGEWVKLAWEPGSKDSLMAWIVYPVRRDKAPVVVVVHEIFGLQTWVRSVADQLAADGFIAIAPDLLSRVRGGASTVELSADTARRLIAWLPALLVMPALIALVLHYGSIAKFAALVRSARPEWLLGALAAQFATYGFAALSWWSSVERSSLSSAESWSSSRQRSLWLTPRSLWLDSPSSSRPRRPRARRGMPTVRRSGSTQTRFDTTGDPVALTAATRRNR